MQDSRNNIMFRKVKTYSGRNDTTADADFYKEQAKIESLRARRENIGERRRVALFGSRDERYDVQKRFLEDFQIQMTIKQQKQQEEKSRESQENQQLERHRKMMDALCTEREGTRRENLRQVSIENRLAALAKSSEFLYGKVMEDLRDREMIRQNILRYNPNVF